MKIDKQLKKLVAKYALASFSEDGQIKEMKVRELTRTLKSLPGSSAIAAISEYVKIIKNEMKKSTLEVESAVTLSPTQVQQITKVIKVKHNVCDVKTSLNESLLGGMRVRIGDMVYDNSLSQKMTSLREAISG